MSKIKLIEVAVTISIEKKVMKKFLTLDIFNHNLSKLEKEIKRLSGIKVAVVHSIGVEELTIGFQTKNKIYNLADFLGLTLNAVQAVFDNPIRFKLKTNE